MIDWWQNLPSQMNPVLLSVGSFQIYWYSAMYLVAFFVVYQLITFRIKRNEVELTTDQLSDYVTWAILGVILGGRLGYALFYDLGYFVTHPVEIFWPFKNGEFTGLSGMSYHGGMLGVIIASVLFTKKNKLAALPFLDNMAVAVPIGYTFGRLGNFINGELYGRTTESAIGMYFPMGGDMLRHPSQLYEGLFEGVILFAILWPLRNRVKDIPGSLVGVYLFGYGFFRFMIEFVRQPDDHLGFVFLSFSMGQILCFAMMFAGILMFVNGKRIQKKSQSELK